MTSAEKKSYKKLMNINTSLMSKIGYTLYEDIYTTQKGEGRKEFGYYHSEGAALDIAELTDLLKLNSVCDLGCGGGLLLAELNALRPNLKLLGYDNERRWLNFAERMLGVTDVKELDLLKITKKDIKGFDLLYLWEPLRDDTLAKIFASKLESAMHKGQILLYRCSGTIGFHLFKNNKFERVKGIEYNETTYYDRVSVDKQQKQTFNTEIGIIAQKI